MPRKLEFKEILKRTGLRPETVGELLDKGWNLVQGTSLSWVGPGADIPVYIPHTEPICDGICGNRAPHLHGLPCFRECPACNAVCHPDCAAYKRGNEDG